MYYFPLGIELIPCMPGLVMSILPGLDEQNEALQKSVLEALRVAGECVGTKYLLGAIWMVLHIFEHLNNILSIKNKRPF